MGTTYNMLSALPIAAKNRYAFVAYIVLAIVWVVIALKVTRNARLLDNLEKLPARDRLAALRSEMGTVRVEGGLTPEQWLRSRRYLYFLIGFIGFLLAAVVVIVVASNIEEPTAKANSGIVANIAPDPHLSALVRFEPSKLMGKPQPHLIVDNIGNVAVDRILSAMQVSGVGVESIDGIPAGVTLQPHATTEFYFPPIITAPSKIEALAVVLVYQSTSTGQLFHSRFRFGAPDGDTPGSPLLPVAIEEGPGEAGYEQEALSQLAAIGRPIGTLHLLLPDRLENGTPNKFTYGVGPKVVQYDPLNHTATFICKYGTILRVSKVSFTQANDGMHVLSLVWNDRARMIKAYVDGNPGLTQ
jgi:hypothetical protein